MLNAKGTLFFYTHAFVKLFKFCRGNFVSLTHAENQEIRLEPTQPNPNLEIIVTKNFIDYVCCKSLSR